MLIRYMSIISIAFITRYRNEVYVSDYKHSQISLIKLDMEISNVGCQ